MGECHHKSKEWQQNELLTIVTGNGDIAVKLRIANASGN